jgi:hypothetical protein
MMTDEPPQSPSDPRDGEPYYIDSDCSECGSELVLYDSLTREQIDRSSELSAVNTDQGDGVWHDEWVCPNCLDGIHLDVPEEIVDEWGQGANGLEEVEEPISVDELTEILAMSTSTEPEDIEHEASELEIERPQDAVKREWNNIDIKKIRTDSGIGPRAGTPLNELPQNLEVCVEVLGESIEDGWATVHDPDYLCPDNSVDMTLEEALDIADEFCCDCFTQAMLDFDMNEDS